MDDLWLNPIWEIRKQNFWEVIMLMNTVQVFAHLGYSFHEKDKISYTKRVEDNKQCLQYHFILFSLFQLVQKLSELHWSPI